MTRLTQVMIADAVVELERMGQEAQIRLADEIFARQPTLLGAVVVLRRFGASDAQISIAAHVLFVAWLSMKRCEAQRKIRWPLITEDDMDLCMQRLTARINFAEGLSAELKDAAIKQQTDDYPERYLLAFAFGYIGEHGLWAVNSDAEKHVLLGALGIVECIAYTASRIKR